MGKKRNTGLILAIISILVVLGVSLLVSAHYF